MKYIRPNYVTHIRKTLDGINAPKQQQQQQQQQQQKIPVHWEVPLPQWKNNSRPSEDTCSLSFLRVQIPRRTLEVRGDNFLRNIGNNVTNNVVIHPRRRGSNVFSCNSEAF